MIAAAIQQLVERQNLDRDQMHEVFSALMDGKFSDVQKSAFLVALRMKGETAEEITGAAQAMRERVIPLRTSRQNLIDTCGTGGDGQSTFNISTVSAIVAASAGANVAKHGNRAVSSACGSADVLSALGVNIDLTPESMTAVLDQIGVAFLFAPKLHPAMASVVSVRRELGIRTIFNILGPVTNPAFARRQVLGVYALPHVATLADVLRALGGEAALVVHSADGMDEISISATTHVAELREGEISTYDIAPEDLGIGRHPLAALAGGDPARNAEIVHAILEGESGARKDVVLANAGAAIYVSGACATLREGVDLAREAIESGRAKQKLQQLVDASNAAGAPR